MPFTAATIAAESAPAFQQLDIEMSTISPTGRTSADRLSVSMVRGSVMLLVFLSSGCKSSGLIQLPLLDAAVLEVEAPVSRIAFGSCARPTRDQSIYDTIRDRQPDVFLFIGDNVYAPNNLDPSLAGLRKQYRLLGKSEPFARLRAEVPLLITWDDHDYGPNDAGGEFAYKAESQRIFNQVWGIGPDDPRSRREGVYHTQTVGPAGQRVQFILLDTRYFRTPLNANPAGSALRYAPQTDPDANMLGEAQWRWLADTLHEPADLRILATSIQVIADGHGFEAWHLMPAQRERLYEVIHDSGAENVILISGDRHSAAIYRRDDAIDYPLYEVTSSSLNVPLTRFLAKVDHEPGPHRLHDPVYAANFGEMEIDWSEARVRLTIRSDQGNVLREEVVALGDLQRP